MNSSLFNIQGAIGLVVVLGGFVIAGIYAATNRAPDPAIVALLAGSIGTVLGFYFGHSRGATQALAQAATKLALDRTYPGSISYDSTGTPPPAKEG